MKSSFWKTTLAVILGLFLYSLLTIAVWMLIMTKFVAASKQRTSIPPKAYLRLDLSLPIQDKVLIQDFSGFGKKSSISLEEIKHAIEYASHDQHIVGILINTRSVNGDWAQTEEIRKALMDFKTSGKHVIAFSDVYDTKAYYLATAADKIYIVPTGNIVWKGFAAQILYYKNLFDKLGIQPVLIRHGEYKSAGEPYVRDHMSEQNREQYHLFLSRLWENVVNAVSQRRGIDKDKLNKLADELAVRGSDYAENYGFVDGQIYYDQLLDTLLSLSNGQLKNVETIDIAKYSSGVNLKLVTYDKSKIAIVYAQGTISDVSTSVLPNSPVIIGDKYAKLIKKLRDDKSVKAIVLRVNSPGGSALASERIWRQVNLTTKVKPVIVSMGGVAASGGYYISCAANKIVADSSTLTGSIGVFGLLFNFDKFMTDKLHINADVVMTNKNADMGNLLKPMNDTKKDFVLTSIENIYDRFISHVAEGRHLDKDYVDSIGRGRVWAAVDAYHLGLIDTIGDLDLAIELAAKEADITSYSIVEYPKQKTIWDLLRNAPYSLQAKTLDAVIPDFERLVKMMKMFEPDTQIWAMMPEKLIIK